MRDINDGVIRRLIGVASLCLFFIVVESIGAQLSKSIAIFTDVAHLLSDLFGFVLSLTSVYYS